VSAAEEGQVRSLLDKGVGAAGDRCARCRGIARGEIAVDFVAYCLQLAPLELGNNNLTPAPESGDKITRFGPVRSQCRAGNMKIRPGFWNEGLFRILEGFPDLAYDDEVDACSGALEMLNAQ
jgi:hypothetical protein